MSDTDQMSRGGIIASFMVGAVVLLIVAVIAVHLQNAPPPPMPPRITIVGTDSIVTNPFSVRFVTDQPVRNGPLGIKWGPNLLHPHLMVDSLILMPGMITSRRGVQSNNVVITVRDTLLIPAPHLSAGPHLIRLFWANASHLNVGDTASIQVRVVK